MSAKPMSPNQPLASEIRQRLIGLIEAKREAGVPIYYVSQIGSDLGVDTRTIEALTGQKLGDFIRDELGFKIGRHGSTGNALFVYFGDRVPVPTKRTRFTKAFWDAFTTSTDQPRFLNIRTLEFGAAEDLLRGTEDYAEIGLEFLPGAGDDEGAADLTSLRIGRWLDATGLDASLFADERGHSRDNLGTRGTKLKGKRQGETLLERLVSALSAEERKGLSLPLDVTTVLATIRLASDKKTDR